MSDFRLLLGDLGYVNALDYPRYRDYLAKFDEVDKPLFSEPTPARAAEEASEEASLLVLFFRLIFNYLLRKVKTATRAFVIEAYHLEACRKREVISFPLLLDETMPTYRIIPEMWFLTIKLPDGSRLAARVDEEVYNRYVRSDGSVITDKSISVDYKEGRYDGVPRLVSTGATLKYVPPYL